ncbi:TRAP transporter substrate-binding protein [Oscillibacter sp. GMB15532]|uniref:TRAP transporter substrate-binding protein n=1 Tax=Oscillibacter sp. GMB15532 TaxID=3230022 RepID=UPI0034DE6749
MKKCLSMLLAGVMTATMLAGCGSTAPSGSAASNASSGSSGEAKLTLKYALTDGENTNYAAGAKRVAELVNQYTDGQIQIQVYAGATLGSEAETIESCANGEIDIATCANSVLENYFPECAALEQPFLWESAEEANYAMTGETGRLFNEGVEAAGMHMIGWMESGFRNIFSKDPVQSAADMQGLKIRTMSSNLQTAMWNSFGAVATPMSATEQYTALQQGTVSAVENAISNNWAGNYYEVAPYVTWSNHYFCYIMLCMSDYAYQKVADLGLMDEFMQGVTEGCSDQWQYLVDYNNDAVDKLTEKGVTFYDLSESDIQTLKDRYAAFVADSANGISFDKTWLDALDADRAAFKNA